MPHTYALQVRSADVDLLQHVNHVRLFDYIDEGRHNFLASIDPALPRLLSALNDDVQFREQVEADLAAVQIDVWVVDVTHDLVTLGTRIWSGDSDEPQVHVIATSEMRIRDRQTGDLDAYTEAFNAHRLTEAGA
ncbi:hypothetical protein BH09ACT10_BH09ACT10_21140 [soil metagenome]